MMGLRGQRAPGRVFLAGPVLLLVMGISTAHGWNWRSHIHVGPPDPSDPYDPAWNWSPALPPDSAPPPESSYHWPSLRQALDQYGWFGRRACKGFPENGPVVAEGSLAPHPAAPLEPEQAPMPFPKGNIRVIVPAGAHVWFDGKLTSQTGPVRVFTVSASQDNDNPTHKVLARWAKGGTPVGGTSTVRVHPGEWVTVDFVTPELEKSR